MAIYYVSSSYTGTTSNGGLNTPWKTLAQVETNANNGTIKAGDTIFFKRGDTFYSVDRAGCTFGCGFRWWAGIYGGTCPKGTINAPITFSAYGDSTAPLPNFLYPTTTLKDAKHKLVMQFLGAEYMILENLQFNDPRDPVVGPTYPLTGRKIGGAQTGKTIQLGEGSGANRCNNIIVRNCYMNNVGYGIISAGDNNLFCDNYFEDFGNCDPYLVTSYGSVGIEVRGTGNIIERNTIKGAWSWAETFAWNGGGLEFINSSSNTIVRYNTFIDCPGIAEFGANTSGQTISNITFCYNKIVNCSSVSYVSTFGQFTIAASGIKFYNNVIIENTESRYVGPNFGVGAENFPTNQTGSCPRLPYPSTYLFDYNPNGPTSPNLFDIRNNAFVSKGTNSTVWNYAGTSCNQTQTFTRFAFNPVTRPRITFSNNIYSALGPNPGHTLGPGENLTTENMFEDEAPNTPETWNYRPTQNGGLIEAGIPVGQPLDYAGANVSATTPSAGLYDKGQGCLYTALSTSPLGSITWEDCNERTLSRTGVFNLQICVEDPNTIVSSNCTVTIISC
jgi:hypothetical protein